MSPENSAPLDSPTAPRSISPDLWSVSFKKDCDSVASEKMNLVSVIVPTYNRSEFVRTAVRSVFLQDYRPIECLVIDDGSTDDTPTVIESLINDCPSWIELRYLKKKNEGANRARNYGLLQSRGDFICYLDSDDQLTPDSITLRVDALINDPEADFSYGLATIADEKGQVLGRMNSPWPKINDARISAYLFHTNSPMIRRAACARAGFWREDDSFSQEFEYFSRLKYVSRGAVFIDRPLSVYVKHSKKSIFDRTHAFYLAEFRVLVLIKALILHSEYDTLAERFELSNVFRRLAKSFYHLKDYHNASVSLLESLSLFLKWRSLCEWIAVTFYTLFTKHQ